MVQLNKYMTKFYWQDIRNEIKQLNPELTAIIDRIDPGSNYPLYRVQYPYGQLIVEKGVVRIPNENGRFVPTSDLSIHPEVKQDFAYVGDEIPAGMLLNKTIEIYLSTDGKILPWILFEKGGVFGLWGELKGAPSHHPTEAFNLSAGARSIFMLPNISDTASHKNLTRDYRVRSRIPSKLNEHWHIFKEIANCSLMENNWFCELLYFSGSWMESLHNDPAWMELHNYFLRRAWNSSAYWRNQQFYRLALSSTQERKNLRPDPYLLDTVKHILSISVGASPGFIAAVDDSAAPISVIQDAYMNSYRLRRHIPTLMHLSYFDYTQMLPQPVYYSLRLPTLMEYAPRNKNCSRVVSDLSDLKYLLQTFINDVRSARSSFSNTILYDIANMVDTDFFHNELDQFGDVRSTKELALQDECLLAMPGVRDKYEFADSGLFFRGCIRISKGLNKLD